MWDLPGPGIEPVSPAFAGGFLTTAPPGKSLILHLEWALNPVMGVLIRGREDTEMLTEEEEAM